jgi:AmmeMemoRadiSam system protein B/AmmeMemoRadiSam system protein A
MAADAQGGGSRPAAVAGRFYPADRRELGAEIDAYLARASVAAPGPVPKMLLVPHAGYAYSGPVAAHAYGRLRPSRGRVRHVVLLGPAHRVAVRGLAAPLAAAFDTPLGRIPVDRRALDQISDLQPLILSDRVHADEHALEVQLPFLQRVLGDFALVPLLVGKADPAQVAAVIERLWGGEETLVVISSDLSHFLPYRAAQVRDRSTVDRVLRLDPELDHEDACGATPLAGALIAARRHGLVPRLLDLRNSGDTVGDPRRVVGYAAVAFASRAGADHGGLVAGAEFDRLPSRGAAGAPAATAEATDGPALGAALLARARNAIVATFGLDTEPEPDHPVLRERHVSFVTLSCGGELRGCIGTVEAQRPLGDDVRVHALAAAFRDPRFEPLAIDEVDALEIEVSVLEHPEPLPVQGEVHARRRLRPGVDGVILEWRGRRATFLPRVWSQLPEPAEFLRALKRKAGLPAGFWAEDLRLARYGVREFARGRSAALQEAL